MNRIRDRRAAVATDCCVDMVLVARSKSQNAQLKDTNERKEQVEQTGALDRMKNTRNRRNNGEHKLKKPDGERRG